MALGKPVIATRSGGTNEVVIDNQNGFLIDSDNKDQLIEKIKTLMIDKTLKIDFGKNGNKMVLEKFDLKIMANNYVTLYQKLLHRKENK